MLNNHFDNENLNDTFIGIGNPNSL